MIQSEKYKAAADPQDVFSFRVSNVTGTREQPLEVNRNSSVGDVTSSIADLMALPDDVAWSLRADRGQFLDENATIGDLLEPDSHVTITPRTHLG
jgi:hypothetical protein